MNNEKKGSEFEPLITAYEVNKKRLKEVWSTLIASYKDTVEYTDHGVTGDPNKTLKETFDRGVSPTELRQTLAVIAHIKEHDGRFGSKNRKWLYDSLMFGSYDWYTEYGRFIGNLDDIHTTHLDNLTTYLRKSETPVAG